MTVIGNFWFLSAIPKKRTSLKQRWKKDTRSSNDERVKKVRKFNQKSLFITLCFYYVNKSIQHTIAIDSRDDSLRQLMKKQRWKANKFTGSESHFQNGDIEVTKAAKRPNTQKEKAIENKSLNSRNSQTFKTNLIVFL